MVTLDENALDALFPFHLVLHESDGLRIARAGRSLRPLLKEGGREARVDEILSFRRPRMRAPALDELLRHPNKPFTLELQDRPMCLRGQFVPLEPGRALFLGSVNIDSADSLTRAGIDLSAFSVLDPTPSIVVLQRVRELQMGQLSRQFAELERAIAQRDEYDRHANSDPLTTVLNRRGFLVRAAELLARDHPGDPWSVLVIDVDRFKEINDGHGHDAGDAVLQAIASRLEGVFVGGVVARWGGDEFVVLDRAPPANVSTGVVERLTRPVSHDGRQIPIGVSIGIATDDGGRDIERMIRLADSAMYHGRERGRGGVVVFDRHLERVMERRARISRLLEPAIEAGEFVPHFQPIVDLRDGRLVGLEALARWHHEELGPVMPAEFIEIAEERNLMVPFDLMMVDRIAEHLSRWRELHPDLVVHVNLSAQSFRPGIAERIRRRLERRSLTPECLVVELTETSLLVNESSTGRVAAELVDHGFAIELDDFGTGYSSLTHLKDIPVAGVKVDMSFVRDALANERTRRLLEGILHITHSLSLYSVAEGVESEDQLALLKGLGCHYAQGHLYAAPTRPEHCLAMMGRLGDAGGLDLAA